MIRIYTLAKELNIESKSLVEICKKAGLTGKGSALASLTDEEVEQVKSFLKSTPPVKSAKDMLANSGSMEMQRPKVSLSQGKIPVLKSSRPVRLTDRLMKKPENKEEPAVEEPAAESNITAPSIAAPNTTAPNVAAPAGEESKAAEPKAVELKADDVKAEAVQTAAEKTPVEEKPAAVEEKTVAEQAAADKKPAEKPVEEKPAAVPASEAKPAEAAETKPAEAKTAETKPAQSEQVPSEKTPLNSVQSAPAETKQAEVKAAEAPVVKEEPAVKDAAEEKKPLEGLKTRKPSILTSILRSGRKVGKEEKTSVSAESAQVSASAPAQTPASAANNAAAPADEPAVPAEPAVPELSPLEKARLAAIAARERMQRPHVIGSNDKKRKNNGDDGNAKSAKPVKPSKPQVAIHFAPMPTLPDKPVKKASKEPAPQKPEIRLPSATIRAASEGQVAPLKDIMREQELKAKKTKTAEETTEDARRSERRKAVKVKPGEVFVGTDLFDEAEKRGKRSKERRRGDDEDGQGKKRRNSANNLQAADDDNRFRQRQYRKKSGGKSLVSTAPRKGNIVIEMPCTVKEFAETTGLSVAAVIKKTMELGAMLTINRPLDEEMAELLIEAFEIKAEVKKEQTLEDQFVSTVLDQEDPPETLRPRPPVVTFLGHVDHGKTSLLDRILKLDVVSGEKGGITQHIRSYRIKTAGGDVTFVDTPGHEAFTEMRARGANCTDIAVLVVAADDGVMPQTEEAISHAKAAGVPIVVALNKMDLPGVNRDRVIQELAANDLMPSEWGGDVEIVETSAVTGKGIDELMETLLTVAELHELKARPDRPATGVAIESSLESGQGVTCKILVQNGTLKEGDIVLCGNAYGKIRAMFDTLDAGLAVAEAGPSTPVTVLGLDVVPPAGSKFVVLDDISVARQIAEERTAMVHERELAGGEDHVTLETLKERLTGAKTQQILNIIIRADVRGSIEAIRKELSKLDHPEVKIKILQASVGGVTEADVLLADASDAVIVGFNVVPDERARTMAEQKKIQIRRYDIIYKLSEDIKAALEGMLKPIEQVKELGRALVQRTFMISRIGTIAGCRVLSGTMERDCQIRVIRNSRVIGEYQLETLKREKDDAREVREGYECGIKLKGYNDLKEGDVFEAYKIEEIARTL